MDGQSFTCHRGQTHALRADFIRQELLFCCCHESCRLTFRTGALLQEHLDLCPRPCFPSRPARERSPSSDSIASVAATLTAVTTTTRTLRKGKKRAIANFFRRGLSSSSSSLPIPTPTTTNPSDSDTPATTTDSIPFPSSSALDPAPGPTTTTNGPAPSPSSSSWACVAVQTTDKASSSSSAVPLSVAPPSLAARGGTDFERLAFWVSRAGFAALCLFVLGLAWMVCRQYVEGVLYHHSQARVASALCAEAYSLHNCQSPLPWVLERCQEASACIQNHPPPNYGDLWNAMIRPVASLHTIVCLLLLLTITMGASLLTRT